MCRVSLRQGRETCISEATQEWCTGWDLRIEKRTTILCNIMCHRNRTYADALRVDGEHVGVEGLVGKLGELFLVVHCPRVAVVGEHECSGPLAVVGAWDVDEEAAVAAAALDGMDPRGGAREGAV